MSREAAAGGAGDFLIENGVLVEYCGDGGNVTVPEGVTHIGPQAFTLLSDSLERYVRFLERNGTPPDGTSELPFGLRDFRALRDGPEAVSLPESLREIGEAAFRGCRRLRSVSLPKGLEELPPSVFEDCAALESVSLPEGLRKLGRSAFRGCRSLRSVSLPEGLEELPENAFAGCGALESAALPESLREIGSDAFRGCRSLRSLRLPEGLESISRNAFRGCTGLADENGFFAAKGVLLLYAGPGGEVTVPEGVKRIGAEVFCADPRGGAYSEYDDDRDRASLLRSVSLPEGLESIEESAFRGCASLESVSLPESLRQLGKGAFRDCRSLREIALPEGTESIPPSAFEGCEALASVSLPKTLRELGERAFRGCRSLREIALPEGTESIPPAAFEGCEALASVSLPETLRQLGPRAFMGCGSLRSLRFPEGLREFGEEALRDCGGLADENGFVIRGGVLFLYAGPGGEVTVPEGVTRIDHMALADLPGTVRLRLPDSLTDAVYDAFRDSRLILRVRRWFPGLDRAVIWCDVPAVLTETVEGVPEALDHAARYGAAFWPEAAFSEEKTREDAAWLAGHAASLREDAFRMPELLHYLCENRLIPPQYADDWLEEARRRDPAGLTAVLLDYLNELGPETMARAREARQAREAFSSAARMRRIARAGPGLAGLRIALDNCRWIDLRSWSGGSGASFAELQERLKALGARLQPELGSRIDYLLSDSGGASGRCRRAAARGIPVITSEELRKLAGK